MASEPHASSNVEEKRTATYKAERGAPRSWRTALHDGDIGRWWKRWWYLLWFVFTPNEQPVVPPKRIEEGNSTSPRQLEMCRSYYDSQLARQDKAEQKGAQVTNMTLIVGPAFGAAAWFIIRHWWELLPQSVSVPVLVLFAIGLGFLLVAFTAAFRVNSVREWTEPSPETYIDRDTGKVRAFDADYYARAYLYFAAMTAATVDQLVDYVRAAQIFLETALVFILLSLIILGGFALPRHTASGNSAGTKGEISSTVPARSQSR